MYAIRSYYVKIRRDLGADIELKDIFACKSIKAMAEKIKSLGKSTYLSIQPAGKRDYYPVSSSQKRLYVLDRFEGVGTAYNIPRALKIEGSYNFV